MKNNVVVFYQRKTDDVIDFVLKKIENKNKIFFIDNIFLLNDFNILFFTIIKSLKYWRIFFKKKFYSNFLYLYWNTFFKKKNVKFCISQIDNSNFIQKLAHINLEEIQIITIQNGSRDHFSLNIPYYSKHISFGNFDLKIMNDVKKMKYDVLEIGSIKSLLYTKKSKITPLKKTILLISQFDQRLLGKNLKFNFDYDFVKYHFKLLKNLKLFLLLNPSYNLTVLSRHEKKHELEQEKNYFNQYFENIINYKFLEVINLKKKYNLPKKYSITISLSSTLSFEILYTSKSLIFDYMKLFNSERFIIQNKSFKVFQETLFKFCDQKQNFFLKNNKNRISFYIENFDKKIVNKKLKQFLIKP